MNRFFPLIATCLLTLAAVPPCWDIGWSTACVEAKKPDKSGSPTPLVGGFWVHVSWADVDATAA